MTQDVVLLSDKEYALALFDYYESPKIKIVSKSSRGTMTGNHNWVGKIVITLHFYEFSTFPVKSLKASNDSILSTDFNFLS